MCDPDEHVPEVELDHWHTYRDADRPADHDDEEVRPR